jgi:hypothetical protein
MASLLSWFLAWIMDLFGRTRPTSTAAETGVFRFPPLYFELKVMLLAAGGAVCLALAAARRWRPESKWLIVLGAWALAEAVQTARGVRSVILAGGLVTVERGVGGKRSWPLADLAVVDPDSWMRRDFGTIPVYERGSESPAFAVPRDLPAWEVLVGLLPSVAPPEEPRNPFLRGD